MAKKKCSRGWGCGNSCISRTKTCRSNLDANGKKIVENFTQQLLRLSTTAGTGGTLGTPKPKTEPISRKGSTKEEFENFMATEDEELAQREGIEQLLDDLSFYVGDILGRSKPKPKLDAKSIKEEIAELRKPIDVSQPQPWASGFRGPKFNPKNLFLIDPKDVAEHTKQFSGDEDKNSEILRGMGIHPGNFAPAIHEFTVIGYGPMRAIDRGEDSLSRKDLVNRREDAWDGKTQVINKFLDQAEPYRGELWRGVNSNGSEASNKFYDQINALKPGDEFQQTSFSSFSSHKGIAEGFSSGERTPIMFKIPKGKNTRGASIIMFSDQPNEAEVLVKKGGYKVTNVIDEGERKIIELEEA